MVALDIDKKEIINGLKMGIYTKEHIHSNPFPDEDDYDDNSGQEHHIYVYINSDYDVTGVKSFFGDMPSMSEIDAELAQEGGEVMIPVVTKEVPEMSVHLGMLTQEEFIILKVCDGMNTIPQVAKISGKTVEEIDKMMQKLHKKGLVKVIRREL
ncbi:MAG: hypothetical protein JW891_05555 [Candidatus Lokiarchaeota archaeon]|nr:hypothetical protein [Candidatus Lokiarchaeota archaeon]